MTDETGHLRPDRALNNVFTEVASDMLEGEHGAVKAGTNKALLDFLDDAREEVVQYHLNRQGFDSVDDLRDDVAERQQADFPGGDGGA